MGTGTDTLRPTGITCKGGCRMEAAIMSMPMGEGQDGSPKDIVNNRIRE